MADVQIAVIDQQNVQIAVIDPEDTQLALAAPAEAVVNVAVPGIQGPVGTTGSVTIAQAGTAATPGIRFESDPNTGIYSPGADQLAVSTGGTERLRITSAGNVGIGTTSPVTVLDVEGGARFGAQNTTTLPASNPNGGAQFLFNRSSGSAETNIANLFENAPLSFEFLQKTGASTANSLYSFGSTTHMWNTNNTERARIDSGGRLLVGTSAVVDQGLVVISYNGGVNQGAIFADADATSGNQAIRFKVSGSTVGSISTTASATAYNTSSDYRLKGNVTLLDGAIARLNQLPVHRFNFIADPDTVVDGFIAHEAQEVVPECVTGEKDAVDDDGNPVYQGIDQSKLVPLLTAALQEAIGEIESLKARVVALEAS